MCNMVCGLAYVNSIISFQSWLFLQICFYFLKFQFLYVQNYTLSINGALPFIFSLLLLYKGRGSESQHLD